MNLWHKSAALLFALPRSAILQRTRARPNPSFELTRSSMAPGPFGGFVYSPPHGPGATHDLHAHASAMSRSCDDLGLELFAVYAASLASADLIGFSVHLSTKKLVEKSILKTDGAIKVPCRDAYRRHAQRFDLSWRWPTPSPPSRCIPIASPPGPRRCPDSAAGPRRRARP